MTEGITVNDNFIPWEWCQKDLCMRGGSCCFYPNNCRSTTRYSSLCRIFHDYDIGFRVVCAN